MNRPDLNTLSKEVRILKLTLKKEWFNMILSGEKTEEYREIKDFFLFRLTNIGYGWLPTIRVDVEEFLKRGNETTLYKPPTIEQINKAGIEFRDYDFVEFTNGYGNDKPRATFECKDIQVGNGKSEWGAPDYRVFKIILGKELSRENVQPKPTY